MTSFCIHFVRDLYWFEYRVTEFSLDVMTSDNHDTLKHKFKNPSSIGTLETKTLVASEVRDMTEMFGICGIFFFLW